jgi:hypothetical protein
LTCGAHTCQSIQPLTNAMTDVTDARSYCQEKTTRNREIV